MAKSKNYSKKIEILQEKLQIEQVKKQKISEKIKEIESSIIHLQDEQKQIEAMSIMKILDEYGLTLDDIKKLPKKL